MSKLDACERSSLMSFQKNKAFHHPHLLRGTYGSQDILLLELVNERNHLQSMYFDMFC